MFHDAYRPRDVFDTHSVTNQPEALIDYNAAARDPALVDALLREGAAWGHERLLAYGDVAGSTLLRAGARANAHPPELFRYDAAGRRIDEVEFHPAYHSCMQAARHHGLHALRWTDARPGAQVLRSALFYLHNQFEAGTACPTTMTHAAVPVLRQAGPALDGWLDKVLAADYDPRNRPIADKHAASIGMGMTEKQGGSDVRANTTRAKPIAGDQYALTGHKWFFSAPMSDAFIVLAQDQSLQDRSPGAAAALSCFFLPRWREDGTRNAVDIIQLKDKLGDRANASSEAEFREAQARRIGEPGRGVATILNMVAQTRLDCMLGSAALIRAALVQAIHHARAREAFGTALVDQPLQAEVLADLALESEAALALSMRVARAFESPRSHERMLARLATPIGKYWICRSAPAAVNEAQECLGGAGYIETSIMPRLFRQSPLNSIWEGAGNVQCLDMLRALERTPETRTALFDELAGAAGRHPLFDAHVARLKDTLADTPAPAAAREVAGEAAQALQAAVLLQGEADWVGAAFCEARFGPRRSRAYGTARLGPRAPALIERAFPC